VCDGYGIWGGGGNFYGQRQSPVAAKDDTIIPLPARVSFLIASQAEKECFDWFKYRTLMKLPASFRSHFWTTLLLQASFGEPAVLHAVLALSSIHRGVALNGGCQEQNNDVVDKVEQLTLQHYLKAIRHLQPHFATRDRASFRVALIACVVFVSLDFLRGHFAAAQIHLQNGLKLLGEMHSLSGKNQELLFLGPCSEGVDEWIVEAFSRLNIQVELFKYFHPHPFLLLQSFEPGPPSPTFSTFKMAWHELDGLLNKIFYLTKQSREHEAEHTSVHQPLELLDRQQRVRTELARWLATYEASREVLRGNLSLGGRLTVEEEQAYQGIRIYHTMMTIMAEMCLCPSDEGAFDSLTNMFVHMIRQQVDLWIIDSTMYPSGAPQGHIFDISRSTIDLGVIAPLHYVAVKCRVHRIRLQAIRLLETIFSREGIWDGKIAACVSRKVMEIEEKDYYKNIDTADDFPLSSYPSARDLSLSPLPESYRIRDLEVVLLGEPMDKVLLFCKQRGDDMNCKVCIGEYHVQSQLWMDVGGK
jgi:hypothetical protein